MSDVLQACTACRHEWADPVNPRCCPRCRSPHWNDYDPNLNYPVSSLNPPLRCGPSMPRRDFIDHLQVI